MNCRNTERECPTRQESREEKVQTTQNQCNMQSKKSPAQEPDDDDDEDEDEDDEGVSCLET